MLRRAFEQQPFRYAARAVEDGAEEAYTKVAIGISASISLRFSTEAKFNRAVDAHAGQWLAEFPTQSQSWQR
jgi:hypothetical protein